MSDESRKVRFFGPHPGYEPAVGTSLSSQTTDMFKAALDAVKSVIDRLDEKEMALNEGLTQINAALVQGDKTLGEIELDDKFEPALGHGAILLYIPFKDAPAPKHVCPILSYFLISHVSTFFQSSKFINN